jgi:hypothetical protein
MHRNVARVLLLVLWLPQLVSAEVDAELSADTERAVDELTESSFAEEEESDPQEAEVIDEITVMGARSLILLRNQVLVAQDGFYTRYNVLNQDDRYDVICGNSAGVGSRVSSRSCVPNIIKDLRRKANQEALQNGTSANFNNRIVAGQERHYRAVEEKLIKFAMEDITLQDKLMQFDTLSKKYSTEHDKKFGDGTEDK